MAAPQASLDATNPFDPAVLVDPWDYYRRLREEAPVYRHPATGLVLVSSFELVAQAVADWETFSNQFARALGAGQSKPPDEVLAVAKDGYPPVDTMLTADPPEQRRYRKLVNKSFSVRRVDQLEPRIREIAGELADRFAAEDKVELASAFAQPLPLTVIAEQLGAPREDLHLFRKWTDGFVAQLGLMADLEGQVEAARLIMEFQKYFVARLEERRADPKKDIISGIVHAHVGEDEHALDVSECLSILQQLLVAGNETTASAICEGMWLLTQNPEQLALVQADLGLVPNAVEEILRMATPTANMWRVCTKDTELGGVEIPAGSMLLLRFAAANRDPAQFPDPDRLDVTRENADEHLSFGQGIHFCLGANLARKEMNVAFETLLGRFNGWALDASAPPPRHRPNMLLWGLESLPLTFQSTAPNAGA